MSIQESLRSEDEKYFYLWLLELKKEGFIKKIEYETVTFELGKPVKYTFNKQLKTKIKKVSKTLLQGHKYTPDFIIEWNSKAVGIFCSINTLEKPIYCNESLISFIEIKPGFNFQGKTSQASVNVKWVYQVYNEYVQILTPYKGSQKNKDKSFLFNDTFTPHDFLYTDKGNKKLLHYNVKSLNNYLKTQNYGTISKKN